MAQPNNVTTMNYGSAVVERMPPNSVDAEAAVLGSILIDPGSLSDVIRVLTPADFYVVKNGWVYKACQALNDRKAPIDFVTLTRELEARGQLSEIGGPTYISELINCVPTALHAQGYAKIVKRLSVRRGLLSILSDAAQLAYDESGDEIESLYAIDRHIADLRLAAISRLSEVKAVISWGDILQTEYPEPTWIVPELMTTGLGFLSGKQKIGKSWLSMQLAGAVGSGGRFFNYKIERGPVLYCALEDTPRRVKSRAQKQHWGNDESVDWMFNDEFEREIGNIASGGADNLAFWIGQRGYKLIIIDTFNRAIGKYFKGGEINDSSIVTRALDRLQMVALRNDASVLIIDHHGKAISNEGGDALNDMVGSIAKGGTADFAWSLYRERGKTGARLMINGRDVEEKDMLLNWDREYGIWQYEGDGSTLKMTLRREELLEFLKKNGRSTLRAIADGVGQPKSHTSDRLKDLVKSYLVKRTEEGENVLFEAIDE